MDTIEKLIKALEEAKEELSKNMNCAPGTPNMGKADEVKPDKGYGKIIIKDTEPKPKDPKNPSRKIIRKEEEGEKVNLNNPYNDQPQDKKKKKEKELEKGAANPALAPKEVKIKQLQAQIDAGTYKPNAKKIADKMLKEELTCSENGQWNLKIKE